MTHVPKLALLFCASACSAGAPPATECQGKCDEAGEEDRVCELPASYGHLSFPDPGYGITPRGNLHWTQPLGETDFPRLLIEVVDGTEPGTYDLSAQSQYESCEICVRAIDCAAGHDETCPEDAQVSYLARAGTLELESFDLDADSGPIFAAQVDGLELQRVSIDWETFRSEPTEPACTTTIESFHAGVPPPPDVPLPALCEGHCGEIQTHDGEWIPSSEASIEETYCGCDAGCVDLADCCSGYAQFCE